MIDVGRDADEALPVASGNKFPEAGKTAKTLGSGNVLPRGGIGRAVVTPADKMDRMVRTGIRRAILTSWPRSSQAATNLRRTCPLETNKTGHQVLQRKRWHETTS